MFDVFCVLSILLHIIVPWRQTGYLEFGPSTAKELNATAAALRACGVPHQIFSGQEANRRYPNQLKLPPTHKCIYQDEGGILYAHRALMAFQVEIIIIDAFCL